MSTTLVTIVVINKHYSRISPGIRFKYVCRGTPVIINQSES